jgi:hypothetical protein
VDTAVDMALVTDHVATENANSSCC